jgi:hypothetical protein
MKTEKTMLNYANHLGYSDTSPYEIVRRVSERCIEIRPMDAVRDPAFTPEFVVGGFSAHCWNQHDQRWIISSNPEARVIRIRLHKDGCWRCKHGARYVLAVKPVKYYDYNF